MSVLGATKTRAEEEALAASLMHAPGFRATVRLFAIAMVNWVRPLGLFLRIITTKGETRLCHGQAFLMATEDKTFERSLAAFRAGAVGARLAEQRPDSLALLVDQTTLESFPPGSLGRCYVEFKQAHGLDENYYAQTPVATAPRFDRSEAHRWYRHRFENGHDMRHLLIGYSPDRLGEICLLSFRAGQTGHFGAHCLTMLGLLHPKVSRLAVFEAYRRGRRSRLVDLLEWEERLAEPLAVVRAWLSLTPPRRFPTPCAPEAYLEVDKPPEKNVAEHPQADIDLADTFGSMSAMHAALNEAGVGMPCGVVARFRGRTTEEVEAAVSAAAMKFPVLRTRLTRRASRPVLGCIEPWRPEWSRVANISLGFKADFDSPVWRYAVNAEGDDVRFAAIWAHAAADGRSMLHFLAIVSAALQGELLPPRLAERARTAVPVTMTRWLPRFLVERHLRYVRIDPSELGGEGVSWITVPVIAADEAVARARTQVGGFAAWLAAAASMAFREQHNGTRAGRVSLNLLVSRGDLAPSNGFGFAAGSLLMPVELDRRSEIRAVAERIYARQRTMMTEAWDEHLERFIGRDPARHRWFASLSARGAAAPTLSVSWKGVYPDLGLAAGVTDVACFATSSAAHVSAHMDGDGLSVSVASRQSPEAREAFLRRIVGLIHDGPADHLSVSAL